MARDTHVAAPFGIFVVTSGSQNTPPPHIDSEKKPLDHRKLPS